MIGTLTLTPSSVDAGARIGVVGTGFGRRLSVDLKVDGTHIGYATTNTKGKFSTGFVASGAAGSGHVLTAHSASPKLSHDGSATFTIKAVVIVPPVDPPPPTGHPADTVWVDDFNGTTLDTTKWRASNYGVDGGGRKCCGSNHANYASEVSVRDGNLVLGAHLIGGVWHTGCIDTETKKTFGYGIWEFRAKVPKGAGLWPALWGYDKPGGGKEIDVLEAGGKADKAYQGIHRFDGDPRTARDTVMPLSDDFHIFGVEWRSTGIQFSIDSVKRGTLISPSLTGDGMVLILNLGMGGGTWLGDPDASTPTSNEMLVDWVRVRA